jgi:hypothetical protein
MHVSWHSERRRPANQCPALPEGNRPMLAVIAAIIFFIAFILRVTSTATGVALAPLSLLLIGLICLALHLAGWGTGWSIRRR